MTTSLLITRTYNIVLLCKHSKQSMQGSYAYIDAN
jgi:hypothetical protein